MNTKPSKALVIRINVILFALFIVAYCTLLLAPFPSTNQGNNVAISSLLHKVR